MPWSRPCLFSKSRASSMIWPMSDLCAKSSRRWRESSELIAHCVGLHRHGLVLAEDDVVRPAEVDRVVVHALACVGIQSVAGCDLIYTGSSPETSLVTWRMTWRRLSSEIGCSPSDSKNLCIYEV